MATNSSPLPPNTHTAEVTKIENVAAALPTPVPPSPTGATNSGNNSGNPMSDGPVLVEPQKPKAPLSGYFLFLGDNRQTVKAANPTLGIGPIGKMLGKMWSELSDEEKAKFTDKAAVAKASYFEKLKEWEKDMAEFVAKGGLPSSRSSDAAKDDPRLPVLPLARIKSIMKKDPDVCSMSKEALFIMTKCTDLFVEHLGDASIRQAYGQKRKSVRVEDINSAIRTTSSARFLEADFPITEPSNQKRQKIKSGVSPLSITDGPINSFFKKEPQQKQLPATETIAAATESEVGDT